MKKIYALGAFLLLLFVMAGAYLAYDREISPLLFRGEQSAAVVLSKEETQKTVSWLKRLQYGNSKQLSFGAITVSDGIAVYEEGTERPLRRVTPYFSHLAVLGILDSGTSGSLTMAQRWIQWYVRNLNPKVGVPLDTWYSQDGSYSTTCPVASDPRQCNTVDAEDSSAALFLTVVDRFVSAGGSKTFVRNNKATIRTVEDTLLALLDDDGVAWAKQSYPIKYLMDNVEVLSGLEAAARIESQVFRDPTRAALFSNKAAVLRTALHSGNNGSFLNTSSSRYAVYEDGAGTQGVSNMQTWYPDLMAQIWPLVFKQGSDTAAKNAVTAIASQLPALALEQGNCEVLKPITANAHAPVLAYALRTLGHGGAELLTKCMYKNMQPTYIWPVTVADVGWLLRR